MATKEDPFTGLWKCNLAKSRFSTPPPLSWVQEINASGNNLRVREEILRPGGPPGIVSVDAQFDGKNYPVHGSPFAEVIAYTREGARIVGTARKNGSVCLRETIIVTPEQQLMPPLPPGFLRKC